MTNDDNENGDDNEIPIRHTDDDIPLSADDRFNHESEFAQKWQDLVDSVNEIDPDEVALAGVTIVGNDEFETEDGYHGLSVMLVNDDLDGFRSTFSVLNIVENYNEQVRHLGLDIGFEDVDDPHQTGGLSLGDLLG